MTRQLAKISNAASICNNKMDSVSLSRLLMYSVQYICRKDFVEGNRIIDRFIALGNIKDIFIISCGNQG